MLKKLPHTYVLLFYFIILAAIATWIVPGGEFQRETKVINGSHKSVIVEGSYQPVEHESQTWQIFASVFKGFTSKSDIIAFIFIVGGAFMIIQRSRAIDIGIQSFLRLLGRMGKSGILKKVGIENITIALLMFVFSIFGSVFGMSEETIPFVMIFIPLAISMGYDSLVGVSMCFIGAALGFAGAMLNPFTIGVAQGIAEIQTFSGIEYRFICFLVLDLIGITFVLRYAIKIKRNPEASKIKGHDDYWRKMVSEGTVIRSEKASTKSWVVYGILILTLGIFSYVYRTSSITIGTSVLSGWFVPGASILFAITGFFSMRKSTQMFLLNLLLFNIVFIIIGVMGHGWFIMEIAAIFMALGVFGAMAMGYSANETVKHFIEGAKDIASAAIVVGLAAGIIEILNDGKVIDTILNEASQVFGDSGPISSIGIMYVFQTIMNIFVPSGSGQAALTMPIMAPLSDLLGVSRQAAVTAYQFGDGITNMITPTAGVLIAVLGIARIPFDKWFKWIWPLLVILIVAAFLLLIPTVTMELNGF